MSTVHHLQTSSTSIDPLPIKWIEALFEKMSLAYGRKFSDQWAGVDPDKLKAHWAQELATMSRAEISRGYNALENRDWPPTLPEFKKLCRPPVDALNAYYEALNGLQSRERGEVGTWSHPAIFWASVAVSAHDLKTLPYAQIKQRWEAALDEQMAKGEWSAIPAPMVALPAPGKGKTDREQAARMLAQYKADTVIQKNGDRAWIGKVLERAKRKDETLPAISLRFAKEALGESHEQQSTI